MRGQFVMECPSCASLPTDRAGYKLQVKDIAELVAEALE
jgi:hypothetical protein